MRRPSMSTGAASARCSNLADWVAVRPDDNVNATAERGRPEAPQHLESGLELAQPLVDAFVEAVNRVAAVARIQQGDVFEIHDEEGPRSSLVAR